VTIDIEIDGRRRHVELDQSTDGWQARVDDRVLTVNAEPIPAGWSLLIGQSGASHEVSVRESGPGILTVRVGGQCIDVRVLDPRAYRRRRSGGSTDRQAGVRHVLAPMPGRVVKVLVKSGDRVTARQGLVVVEAMKMENELRAPADAIVRDVRTAEGASVEAGAILLVLE
jgi:acetyl/propionyl-CoA carboxylase alpha subunit